MNGSIGHGPRLPQYGVCAWLLLAGFLGADAQAQTCGETYLGQGNPTQLILVDESTNPFSFPVLGTAPFQYNALAYRPANDTLYAVRSGVDSLLQINLDGSATTLGTVTGLPTAATGAYHVGVFAPDGFMYVRRTTNTTTLYRIDVDALTATAVNLSQAVSFSDLAWFDGAFYGVSAGDLVSVTPTGTVTPIGPTGVGGGFGAMFSASNGIFGVRNDGTGFYQFDVTTGAATLISGAPGSGNNDGARCLNAAFELEADLSVTKTDDSPTYLPETDTVYEIVVTNNGPFGVQNASVSDPLPAGITTASWTCAGSAGGVCGAAGGSGAIVDTPDLPVGASVTYTFTVAVPPDFSGDLVNTVTVELPEGFMDPTPADNSATDVDTSAAAPSISLDKSGSSPDPLTLGATIDYTFVVTNTGNVTLMGVTVTDPLPGLSPISCPGTILASGESMTCTASYTVTQADVDAGFLQNTATATGDPPGGLPQVSDEDSTTVPPSQLTGIQIDKSGSGPDPLTVDATIVYTFLVVNTGNVTLMGVTVTDPLPGLSAIECPSTVLAPGETMTCTASYTVTQADVDAGVVENTATVTGDPPGALPQVSGQDSASVPPTQDADIALDKSGTGPDPLAVGATVVYSFVVMNTGNATLTGVTVTDPLPGLSAIECLETVLAPGDQMTCTASYVVTQADVDERVILNTATVTAETGSGVVVSDQGTAAVPPEPSLLEIPTLSMVGTLLLVLLLSAAALWALRGGLG